MVSDNIQSGASMGIYGGIGACASTIHGAGGGICVLEPWLTHAWVFAMTFQFDTCPDGHICNQVSIGKRRPYLLMNAMITPPSTATFLEAGLTACRQTTVGPHMSFYTNTKVR